MRIAAALLAGASLCFGSVAVAQTDAKVEIGKKAPDFTATGIDGKKFKLSERMGKDKNIVLIFSRASW